MRSPLNADPQVVEAEIQVGENTVTYRRAGAGAPVLLLQLPGPGPAGRGNGVEADTFLALAQGKRVFQPMTPIPRSRDHAEKWLLGVVEGLGLLTPDVVADPELAPTLARLVRHNGGLVGQVTFLAGTERSG